MDARRQTVGTRWIVVGLLVQAASILVIKSVEHPSPTGLGAAIAMIAGTVAYITGLAYYAKAKGQRAAWCLLGLFSLLGLSIIIALPDLD